MPRYAAAHRTFVFEKANTFKKPKQKEGTYQNGLWNGKWTYWNKKGIRYAEGQFKDGKLHGTYNWYYDSGKKYKQVW